MCAARCWDGRPRWARAAPLFSCTSSPRSRSSSSSRLSRAHPFRGRWNASSSPRRSTPTVDSSGRPTDRSSTAAATDRAGYGFSGGGPFRDGAFIGAPPISADRGCFARGPLGEIVCEPLRLGKSPGPFPALATGRVSGSFLPMGSRFPSGDPRTSQFPGVAAMSRLYARRGSRAEREDRFVHRRPRTPTGRAWRGRSRQVGVGHRDLPTGTVRPDGRAALVLPLGSRRWVLLFRRRP